MADINNIRYLYFNIFEILLSLSNFMITSQEKYLILHCNASKILNFKL